MNNSWRGWVIDKSLKDTAILSKLKILKSYTEENVEADKKQVWDVYTVEVEDKDIVKTSKLFENLIKPGYYTHFTDGNNLLIIFPEKSFKIRLKNIGEEKPCGITDFEMDSKDKNLWKSAIEYGVKEGKVDKRYLIKVE